MVYGADSAGKTTITRALHQTLHERGYKVEWLDGDVVRLQLSKDLGFSKEDRDENIRRIGALAGQLTESGTIVLVSAISPYRAARDEVRRRVGAFLEVWVHAPLAVCEQRDIKGIYRRARAARSTTSPDWTTPTSIPRRPMWSAAPIAKPWRKARPRSWR